MEMSSALFLSPRATPEEKNRNPKQNIGTEIRDRDSQNTKPCWPRTAYEFIQNNMDVTAGRGRSDHRAVTALC
jgi:hypothetical protein